MKLSIVIPTLNQIDLAKTCYKEILDNSFVGTEFIILDNGSDEPIKQNDFPFAKIIRNEKNTGVYPTFKQGMEVATGDVVAFLHSDVVVWEKGWDKKVLETFEKNTKLGLVGFIGSDEIGADGGRGLGTASNFQGKEITDGNKVWQGSAWNKHGALLLDYMKGAVVDGCVMILSRDAWNKIGYREDFPPHHFYDRLISTQVLEAGYSVGVLGIECDHISGQTVNQEKGYQKMGREWLRTHIEELRYKNLLEDIPKDISQIVVDQSIYLIAEKMWLDEYRDKKHLIPIKV